MKIYTGKDEQDSSQPLGSRVVNHMANAIEQHSEPKRHELFFNNFFTSYSLIQSLAEQEMRATGTVREYRMSGANNRLVSNKELKKKGRGHFDFVCDGKV